MAEVIIIISLGWLANLFVQLWITLMRKTDRWITAKPFSCEECMGAWVGISYAIYANENLLIFGALSSLSAALLLGIINKLNAS